MRGVLCESRQITASLPHVAQQCSTLDALRHSQRQETSLQIALRGSDCRSRFCTNDQEEGGGGVALLVHGYWIAAVASYERHVGERTALRIGEQLAYVGVDWR